LTVLVGELFVPAKAAEPLGEATLEWTERERVEEAVLLSGVPIAHGPEEHRAYYVATPEFRDARLPDTGITPMSGGYLEASTAR